MVDSIQEMVVLAGNTFLGFCGRMVMVLRYGI